MKIYNESVYLVLSMSRDQFDSVMHHLISGSTNEEKYLLGNERERKYLSDLLNIEESELDAANDYFKLVVEEDIIESMESVCIPLDRPTGPAGYPELYLDTTDYTVYYRDRRTPNWRAATKSDLSAYLVHVKSTQLEQHTFVDSCVRGFSTPSDIDNAIDAWHRGAGGTQSLIQFLGLTNREYARWIRDPASLNDVIAARKALLGLGEVHGKDTESKDR